MPTLLISDTNILMDVEAGGLASALFSLPYTFVVPDILYEEELEESFPHMVGMGLLVRELSPDMVQTAEALARNYCKIGANDRLALALALGERVDLLTGDDFLRRAAIAEGVEVRGTIWLLQEMIRDHRITREVALSALERMEASGRRLPWDMARTVIAGM